MNTILDNGRYLLLQPQGTLRQDAMSETRWLAQEMDPTTHQSQPVLIIDVVAPTNHQRQLIGRAASRAFVSTTAHNGIATLLNAFMEHEHCFFVFACTGAGSLQERINHYQLLSESEAMSCLQQVAKTLQFLAQQNPPIQHGWICPAHLIQHKSQWVLMPGSALIAEQVMRSLPPTPDSTNMGRNLFDAGQDLLALFQTIYTGLTGVQLSTSENQGLPHLAPSISPSFRAILARGLQSGFRTPDQLLALIGEPAPSHQRARPQRSGRLAQTQPPASHEEKASPSPSSAVFSVNGEGPLSAANHEEQKKPVSFGGEFPPFPPGHDFRTACYWGGGIILAEMLFLVFSR